MSKVYGPVALTTGATTFQDVGVGAPWVVIENSSLAIDLGVSFQVNDPGPVAQFSGSNAWAGVVQAGGSKRFALPSNDGQWTGRVWLFPLSVATLSAATGTSSGYSRAYITVFGQNEQPLDFQGVIRGLDLTSQPRVITIPAPLLGWTPRVSTLPAAINGTLQLGSTTTLNAAELANNSFNFYLSYFYLALTQPGRCVLLHRFQFQDATHTPVGTPLPLLNFYVANSGAAGPATIYTASFPQPLCYTTTLPTGAVEVVQQLVLASGDTSLPCVVISAGVHDLVNAKPIADTGNATLHLSPASLY